MCVCVPVCKESKTIFGERKQQQQRSSRQTGAYTGVFARHGRLVDGVSEKRKNDENENAIGIQCKLQMQLQIMIIIKIVVQTHQR